MLSGVEGSRSWGMGPSSPAVGRERPARTHRVAGHAGREGLQNDSDFPRDQGGGGSTWG